jgi:hypothetical protein
MIVLFFFFFFLCTFQLRAKVEGRRLFQKKILQWTTLSKFTLYKFLH